MRPNEAGQALLEFAAAIVMLLVLVFGVIDFSRAIYQKEVMVQLTREGSDLASRGDSLSQVATTLAGEAGPLNLNATGPGLVIVTSVTNVSGATPAIQVSGQYQQGTLTGVTSKIGSGVVGTKATLPAAAAGVPPANQTLYVTEIYYPFKPITPLGSLVKIVFPGTLYDVAFF
jgi:Flp pilus assembly protein TadG